MKVTSKMELVSRLREMGYEVEIIDTIPYVINAQFDVVESVVKSLGWNGSYGVMKRREKVCVVADT